MGLENLTDEQREEGQRKMQETRDLSNNVPAMVAALAPTVANDARMNQIKDRLEMMPPTCRMTYKAACEGKSRKAAIKAHCQECVAWDQMVSQIEGCTARGCPLWLFRPYKPS